MSVAKVFKDIRQTKGYTQVEMAKLLEVSLPSLKRFEANNVGMPGTGTLNNLAKIAELTTTEVVRKIFFEGERYPRNLQKYMQVYVSDQYLKGYSYEIEPTFTHSFIGMRAYDVLLTKRRESDNRVLLDTLCGFPKHWYKFDDEAQLKRLFIDKIIELDELVDLPKLKEYRFVEDYNNEFSCKVYDAMSSFTFGIIKMSVSIVLYDYKTQQIIKSHNFTK